MNNEDFLKQFTDKSCAGLLDSQAVEDVVPKEVAHAIVRYFRDRLDELGWTPNVDNAMLLADIEFLKLYPESPIGGMILDEPLDQRVSDAEPEEYPIERGVGLYVSYVARKAAGSNRAKVADAVDQYLEHQGVYPADVIQEPLFE